MGSFLGIEWEQPICIVSTPTRLTTSCIRRATRTVPLNRRNSPARNPSDDMKYFPRRWPTRPPTCLVPTTSSTTRAATQLRLDSVILPVCLNYDYASTAGIIQLSIILCYRCMILAGSSTTRWQHQVIAINLIHSYVTCLLKHQSSRSIPASGWRR